MKQTTTTTAAAIAPILQSYINVCGITQYVEPIAANFDVVKNINCDLRICNLLSTIPAHRAADYHFIVSDADFRDLRLPERTQVLIYCDRLNTHRRGARFALKMADTWDWCGRQAAAGHIVAVRDYTTPDDLDCVCVWQSAPDKLGRIAKLFIFGGGNHAENTRS